MQEFEIMEHIIVQRDFPPAPPPPPPTDWESIFGGIIVLVIVLGIAVAVITGIVLWLL